MWVPKWYFEIQARRMDELEDKVRRMEKLLIEDAERKTEAETMVKETVYSGTDCWLMGNEKTVNKEFLRYVADTAVKLILQKIPSDIRTVEVMETVIEEMQKTVRCRTYLKKEMEVKLYANNEEVEGGD